MMFSYPYFSFPYYNRYSRYGYRYPNSYSSSYFSKANSKGKQEPNHIKKETNHNIHSKSNPTLNDIKKEECPSNNEDSPLFQIFGINLYFDDILLVCLIFFLYQEGVKDESLFIALILLLLS